MKIKKTIIFLVAFLLFQSCCKVEDKVEPTIKYCIEEKSLKDPFVVLSDDEKTQDWGKEYTIALSFAKKLDLYRAISTFKRAEVLLPSNLESKKQQIEYFIVLCYFLAQKYDNVIESFENSSLPYTDKSFIAFHDLILIIHESYKETGEEKKAVKTKNIIDNFFSESTEQLNISTSLSTGDINEIKILAKNPTYDYLDSFVKKYEFKKKSVSTAQTLNAIIPGSGYLYLGQKKSAISAFLLNSLFIFASYEFFHKDYIAAGVITTSFEAGWYFGGIYGAGEEAKFYNEKIYNEEGYKLMKSKKLFPCFLLRYLF